MRRRRNLTAFFFFSLVFFVYLFSYRGTVQSDDEQLFAAVAQNLAFHGSFTAEPLSGNSRLAGQFNGAGIAHVVMGALATRLLDLTGFGFVQGLLLLPVVYLALTGTLVLLFVSESGYPLKFAVFAACVFAFGSIAWVYSQGFFRETIAALFVAGSLFYGRRWVSPDPGEKNFFSIALFLVSIVGLVLTKAILVLIIPGVLFAIFHGQPSVKLPRQVKLRTILWVTAVIAAAVLVGRAVIPADVPTRYDFPGIVIETIESIASRPQDHFISNLLAPLFSPGRGLLFFSPLIFLGLFSWIANRSGKLGGGWGGDAAAAPPSAGPPKSRIGSDKNLSENSEGRRFWGWLRLRRSHPQNRRPNFRIGTKGLPIATVWSVAVLVISEAAVFGNEGWSLAWGPRRLLPVLPLIVISGIPLYGALVHSGKTWIKFAFGLLLAVSVGIQLGGVLVSKALVRTALSRELGDFFSDALVWDFRHSPTGHTWRLLLSGVKPDLAIFRLSQDGISWMTGIFYFLIGTGIVLAVTGLVRSLSQETSFRSNTLSVWTGVILALTPLFLLSAARSDPAYFDEHRYREAAAFFEANVSDDETLIVDHYLSPFWQFFINYNGNRHIVWHSLPVPGENFRPRQSDTFRTEIAGLSAHDSIWIVSENPEFQVGESFEHVAELLDGYTLVSVNAFTDSPAENSIIFFHFQRFDEP